MKHSPIRYWLRSLAVILSFFSFSAQAQQLSPEDIRCGTVMMDSIRHAQIPNLQTNEEFEEWLQKLIMEKRENEKVGKIIDGVYQIPVVFHIIHDGDAVGTGDNISQAAVESQVDVLNEDFRKMFGTPGWNTHIAGADTKIEFCLARRRPDGTAFPNGEDGINRVDRNSTPWSGTLGAPPYTTAEIDASIKPWSTGTDLGGWDPADYMNIWVVDISGGILGYAQFPTTVLGGMGCGTQSTSTDGVVFLTTSIGKSSVTGYPGPYNEGRTATHEIGHWLGLRHIWGDGGCGVDDYCADTPLSDASNFGCVTTNSCTDNYSSPPWPSTDPNDMVENYMDYSDDGCMNIFTYDQMTRMRTVLENSPIRASLITSDACIPPATDDASIVDIIAPLGDNCAGSITPTVTIRNRGSNTLTSATIEYMIDGGTPTSFSWTGSVAPANETNVTLPAFTAPLGVHTFAAYSVLPNGVIDPDPTYDTTVIDFAVSNGYQPDHMEDFEGGTFPPDVRWLDVNANDDCMMWIGQTGTSSAGTYPNDAGCAPFYNNNGSSQEEYLYTPLFILPCNASYAEVVFDHAYRRRINSSSDRLRLEMSLDCGSTWTTTLFDQQGSALATGANSNSYWIPSASGDWNNNVIDLSSYVTGSSQSVQFRFRATNAGNQGGNVYVDNFEFNAITPAEIEVSVSGLDVLDEGFYDFGAQPIGGPTTATFTIENTGTSDLILTGPIVITGTEFSLNTTFGTTTVPAGGSTTFSVDFTPTGAGPYTGTVSFGTNDCDEGTYNFDLYGIGNVSPPTAAFTASASGLCAGGTITYTDASVGATSWTWSFPGGTPSSATGVGPHTITYNTAGTYDAQLTVTNSYGSDVDLHTNAVTVSGASGAALPIVEGFNSGTFVPTNWGLGNGGNQSVTWTQDGNNNGTAPTAGNSTVINFFSTNTSGDQDSLFVETADFSNLSSAQLTFDVAYARYNATYSDGMRVIVSGDCGASWNIEYDKSGSTLATDPDQTGAYTSPSTWRNETIDLSAYVGNSGVQIAFVGISGYGQYLYVDNVNLSGVTTACVDPDVPTVTFAPGTYCEGNTVTLTITGNLNDATDWNVYSGSCGGTLVGTTSTGTIDVTLVAGTNDFFVRGEGGCVTPGSCGTVSITAGANTTATDVITACDSYTWIDGMTYTSSNNTATHTLTNAAGCDSVVTLNLTINNSTTGTDVITACDSYTWIDGMTYTSSNSTATHTLTNAAGCDSVVTLNLTINNSTTGTDVITACDTYTWIDGMTYTSSNNTATHTLTNAVGCDSVVTLNLTINNSTTGTDVITACDTYTWIDGMTYTSSNNTATHTLTNAAGCDSVVTLNLTINNSTTGTDVITACDSYTWIDGMTYTSSNSTATHTLTNAAGCDSVVTLNLTINNSTTATDVITACGSYTWIDGMTYTSSNNTATHTLSNAAGCDSVVTLDLTISTFASGTDVITACDTYTWIDGMTYTSSNNTATHTIVGGSVNGCDSVVTLNLTINYSTTGTDVITACDSYTWIDGMTYTSSNNTATHTLTNAAGCDSVVTLNLTINNSTTGTDVITACDSYTWIDGMTYTSSNNTATHTLTNAAGCDSVVTLNLTINNSTTATDVITACNSYTWIDGMTYTSSNNTATHTLTNAAGCDSVVTLNLTISTFASGTDVITACDSYTWIDGMTYTSSNNTATHTIVGGSVNGCDSVVTLNLTINYSTTGTDVITACDSYTWIDGMTYTSSNNTATHTIVGGSVNGCDSVVTLNLTINYSTTGTDVITACDTYTWIDGMTYTSSNTTATHTLANAAGCDSVVTLNLTINNSTTGTDVITACDTYTWIDGMTYTSSNTTATHTLTNAAGCDSVVTLNLTINNSTTGTDVITACDSYTWIDGMTYTSSNTTATHTLTNAAGCDSVVTLNLTINNSTTGTDVITACDSYTWIDGMTYTSSNNTATYTTTNAAGCDSVVTLDLTINYSTTGTDVVTACDSYTWIDGMTYTSSNNTATYTTTNAAGCDSVVTLDLTINTSVTSSQSATICDGESYQFGSQTLTASGNYTEVFAGANGCDSTVDLTLTVDVIDVSVTQVEDTLTANATGSTYQWIDCDNGNAAVAGATSQTFVPTATGNYAVVVTSAFDCSDTSACYFVDLSGIDENDPGSLINVFPNPAHDAVTIAASGMVIESVSVYDAAGRLVSEINTKSETVQVDLSEYAIGVYQFKVTAQGAQTWKKVLKE